MITMTGVASLADTVCTPTSQPLARTTFGSLGYLKLLIFNVLALGYATCLLETW